MDIELEELNNYRFYHLNIIPENRCKKCNGLLWLFRDKGTLFRRCRHVDCLSVYDITRKCSYCHREYPFEDITCDKCEKVVVDITTQVVSIEEADKAVKKINSAYKKGVLTEKEWKASLHFNTEEKQKCVKTLEKIIKDKKLTLNLSIP